MKRTAGKSNWVTVGEFSHPPEAHIALGALQNEGIPAVIIPDIMATIYGAGSTWAPIRLAVPANMAKKAGKILGTAPED